MPRPRTPTQPFQQSRLQVVVGEAPTVLTSGAMEPGLRRNVLAWGVETSTGLVKHIRDLSREQTGQACGIECVGCGRALVAFNAGAVRWRHRPHFKHPVGIQREDCHIVAARLSLVDALTREGLITLPAQRQSGSWIGLSGTRYEVWRNIDSEQMRVRSVSYTDRTRALITLADGRRLAVILRGEFSLGNPDGDLACLTIEAGADAELLSQLSSAELRERLTLFPDLLKWRCHWKDNELSKVASAEALEQARQALDEWPTHIADEAEDRRRESLLHRLVREILVDARIIQVPGWDHPSELGTLRNWAPVLAHRLTLSALRAERGLAGRIPDVQCEASAEDARLSLTLLVIEVIVHNDVTEEKLAELRAAGSAVLAVSLADWGGLLSMKELRSIVLAGLDCKRWLYHPLREAQAAEIAADRALSAAWAHWRRLGPVQGFRSKRRSAASADGPAVHEALLRYGSMYRQAAIDYFDALRFHSGRLPTLEEVQDSTLRLEEPWAHLCRIASELDALGAPGGTDEAVLSTLMARMLSICENRGIGHAPSQNARAVINHVWTEVKVRDRRGHANAKPSPGAALSLIAFQVYEMQMRNGRKSEPFEHLRAIAHQSLAKDEPRFLWDRLYVPLMCSVFPELIAAVNRLSERMDRVADSLLKSTPTRMSIN